MVVVRKVFIVTLVIAHWSKHTYIGHKKAHSRKKKEKKEANILNMYILNNKPDLQIFYIGV